MKGKTKNESMEEIKEPHPANVKIDDKGQFVDADGNVMQVKTGLISTLKINQKKEQERRLKQMMKMQKETFGSAAKRESKYFDSSLEEAQRKRERRKLGAFSFVEQGTYIKRGEMIRKKQTLDILNSGESPFDSLTNAMTSSGGAQLSSLGSTSAIARILSKGTKVKPPDPIPDVEWWDATLLPAEKKTFSKHEAGAEGFPKEVKSENYAITEQDILMKRINNLVQHPTVVKNEYIEKINNSSVKVMLTDKEKKKLSRIKRLEKEKDKREKIRLGLAEPPPPKIKMSNYMQILSREAVADPSKTEAEVKKMVEARMMQHLRHNLERKLTPQQKFEKMKRKLNRDLNEECRTALFRIETLIDPSQRFKVDVNAQEYMLTGLCIIPDRAFAKTIPTLVVVEGGPWAIKKYKKLLLRRIKWAVVSGNLPAEEKERVAKEIEGNKVGLVWEGVVKKRIFDKWKLVDVRSENEARRVLADKAVDHYWNMVISHKYGEGKAEIKGI